MTDSKCRTRSAIDQVTEVSCPSGHTHNAFSGICGIVTASGGLALLDLTLSETQIDKFRHFGGYRLFLRRTPLGQSGEGVAKLVRFLVMGRKALLQPRVVRFRLLVDGDVGVGVFPEREEIFVSGERPDAGGIGIRSLTPLYFGWIGAAMCRWIASE